MGGASLSRRTCAVSLPGYQSSVRIGFYGRILQLRHVSRQIKKVGLFVAVRQKAVRRLFMFRIHRLLGDDSAQTEHAENVHAVNVLNVPLTGACICFSSQFLCTDFWTCACVSFLFCSDFFLYVTVLNLCFEYCTACWTLGLPHVTPFLSPDFSVCPLFSKSVFSKSLDITNANCSKEERYWSALLISLPVLCHFVFFCSFVIPFFCCLQLFTCVSFTFKCGMLLVSYTVEVRL